jgi:ABC-type sugar transport system permease subunit
MSAVTTTPPQGRTSSAASRRTRSAARRLEGRAAGLMAAPAVLLLVMFLGIPVLLAVALSFTNARLVTPDAPEFVGLDNFRRVLFQDPTFLRSVLNTFLFAAIVVPLQGSLGLAMALLVNQKLRGVTAFRTIYFLPVVTSIIVVSIVWTFMYQEDGLINSVLNAVTGGAYVGRAWLLDPSTALPAIVVLSIWQGVGFHMIIWLSGLQTISETLYEAADVDGATGWQKFRYVTLPGLRPTLVFVVITITIASLGLFAQVDVMTRGGPLDATTTIMYHGVRRGFREQEVGVGAAISLIFFALVLIVSLIQRRLTRED